MDHHHSRLTSYDTPARRAMLRAETDPEPWPTRAITLVGVVIVGLIIGAILGIAIH